MKLTHLLCFFTFLILQFLAKNSYSQNKDIVKLSVQNPTSEIQKGQLFAVDLVAAINPSWHINSNKPNDEFLIPTVVSAKGNGIKLVKVRYPKPLELKFSFSESPVSVFEGETKIGLTFEVQENAAVGKQAVEVVLDYQACNDVTCLPPNTVSAKFEVAVSEKSAVTGNEPTAQDTVVTKDSSDTDDISLADIKNQNLSNQTESIQQKDDSGSVASTLEKSGLFLSLLFIFLAGLALNLTPCVYPLNSNYDRLLWRTSRRKNKQVIFAWCALCFRNGADLFRNRCCHFAERCCIRNITAKSVCDYWDSFAFCCFSVKSIRCLRV